MSSQTCYTFDANCYYGTDLSLALASKRSCGFSREQQIFSLCALCPLWQKNISMMSNRK